MEHHKKIIPESLSPSGKRARLLYYYVGSHWLLATPKANLPQMSKESSPKKVASANFKQQFREQLGNVLNKPVKVILVTWMGD